MWPQSRPGIYSYHIKFVPATKIETLIPLATLVEYMSDEMYCEEHDLQSPAYEDTPDPHCPYCREERRQREQRIHEMTRDPTLEPW